MGGHPLVRHPLVTLQHPDDDVRQAVLGLERGCQSGWRWYRPARTLSPLSPGLSSQFPPAAAPLTSQGWRGTPVFSSSEPPGVGRQAAPGSHEEPARNSLSCVHVF